MQLSVTPFPAYHDIYYNLLEFSAADEIKIEMCVPHPPIPPLALYSWCSISALHLVLPQRSTFGVPISALQLVFPSALYSWCSHQRYTVGVPISALHLVFPSELYSWCSHQRSTVDVPISSLQLVFPSALYSWCSVSALQLVRLYLPIRILIKITSGIFTVFYLCW